ncbi:hypothetical protein, conserved [Eimeria praecox]|uniref:Uncharacterized protein n=1 Tax=Eimeria praecox TaxID=51316 RepID=U6GBB2_9EIME|nr:hypothetical protein, conserved [Eimeria praecox]
MGTPAAVSQEQQQQYQQQQQEQLGSPSVADASEGIKQQTEAWGLQQQPPRSSSSNISSNSKSSYSKSSSRSSSCLTRRGQSDLCSASVPSPPTTLWFGSPLRVSYICSSGNECICFASMDADIGCSRPFVQIQVVLPDLRIQLTATTKAVQGENPHINQALNLTLPEAAAVEAGVLQRQRGCVRISVFDEFLQQPNTSNRNEPWLFAAPSENTNPRVLLGCLELPWSSVVTSATGAAAKRVGSSAALQRHKVHMNPQQRQQQQQQLLNEMFDVAADGTCCIGLLNGCFRMQQPKGLLTHIHLSRPQNPNMPTDLLLQLQQQQQLQQQVLLQHFAAVPFDLFVSLKLEIRGPAKAICCCLPRILMPEEMYQQQQEDMKKGEEEVNSKYGDLLKPSAAASHAS